MKRLSLVLAGALVATLAVPAVSAEARSVRPMQRIHVNGSRHVVAPSTLRPGLVHLDNTGDRSIIIVKRRSGNVATVVRDYNSPTPRGWEAHFVTVDSLRWRNDAYVGLTRGTYYLIDESLRKLTASRVKTLTVKGSTWNAKAPAAQAITISGSANRITAPGALPTRRWLHLANRTANDQIVMVYGIGAKTTPEQLSAFVAAPSLAKLRQLDLTTVNELTYTSGHRSLYAHLVTARGRYLLLNYAYPKGRVSPLLGKGQAVALTVG